MLVALFWFFVLATLVFLADVMVLSAYSSVVDDGKNISISTLKIREKIFFHSCMEWVVPLLGITGIIMIIILSCFI